MDLRRDIKFRTWNPKHKYFYFWGFNTEIDGKPYFVGTPSGGGFISDEIFKYTEQFTGLHDKNGKEIYEGDVVHGSYGIPPRGVTSVVEYKESAFVIDTTGHKPESVTLKTGMECLDLEVIGNIHENPELMK